MLLKHQSMKTYLDQHFDAVNEHARKNNVEEFYFWISENDAKIIRGIRYNESLNTIIDIADLNKK